MFSTAETSEKRVARGRRRDWFDESQDWDTVPPTYSLSSKQAWLQDCITWNTVLLPHSIHWEHNNFFKWLNITVLYHCIHQTLANNNNCASSVYHILIVSFPNRIIHFVYAIGFQFLNSICIESFVESDEFHLSSAKYKRIDSFVKYSIHLAYSLGSLPFAWPWHRLATIGLHHKLLSYCALWASILFS